MELLTDPQAWIAFFTLTALELVLGIDNIIFISILVDRLPPARREFTRRIGLALAMFMRIALLLVLAWIVGVTAPLFSVLGEEYPASRSAIRVDSNKAYVFEEFLRGSPARSLLAELRKGQVVKTRYNDWPYGVNRDYAAPICDLPALIDECSNP